MPPSSEAAESGLRAQAQRRQKKARRQLREQIRRETLAEASRFEARARKRQRKRLRTLQQKTRQELLAEASRFPESMGLMEAGQTPPRAVPVEPAALADAGPIALDPAIGSFGGRPDAAGSREENVAPDHGSPARPENGSNAPETPPAPSTPLAPSPAGSPPTTEDRRPSLASVERTAMPPPAEGDAVAPLPVRCQCGAVRFSTPAAAPLALYHCHCTECQRQSAFGTSALYPAAALFPLAAELALALRCWTRPTDAGGRMHCYFCPACGARLFHRSEAADGTPRATVSIKAGCIEGLDWRGAQHIYTRSAVVAIPAGAEQYDTLPGEEAPPPASVP